ncbi:MAG: hypothetical protein U1C53_03440 [Candidatus Veblenbacteria bacterium]|nr:hypothetical protein [Candidatus Veblenbacteria bacterium]MDZ4230168.1 hypothetical protein [Candidatus Veblenbacteria bacterium]
MNSPFARLTAVRASGFSVVGAAVLLGLLGSGAPRFVFAQAGSAISLAPLTFELTANPGETVENVVRVYNNGDQPVTVVMQVQDFAAAGERGEVVLQEADNHTFSLASWVSVEPTDFVLPAKEFKPVTFKVALPPNAEPGGHYGTVLASVTGVASGTGAALAQKIGSLILLQVPGVISEQLALASLEAPGFSEYGPVTLTARFKNDGSVHLKPRGFVLVKGMTGREVARLDIPQQNVLPTSVRRIDVDFLGKWHWGRYTATLTAIYGSTNEPLSASVAFWIFPWKVSLAVLIAAFIVLYALYRGRRRLAAAGRVLVKGS